MEKSKNKLWLSDTQTMKLRPSVLHLTCLDKITTKKECYLSGDFSIDLLKYEIISTLISSIT